MWNKKGEDYKKSLQTLSQSKKNVKSLCTSLCHRKFSKWKTLFEAKQGKTSQRCTCPKSCGIIPLACGHKPGLAQDTAGRAGVRNQPLWGRSFSSAGPSCPTTTDTYPWEAINNAIRSISRIIIFLEKCQDSCHAQHKAFFLSWITSSSLLKWHFGVWGKVFQRHKWDLTVTLNASFFFLFFFFLMLLKNNIVSA